MAGTHQMRVLVVVDDSDVVELDVEVLIHRLEGALDLDIILELDHDHVVDESLEEAGKKCGQCRVLMCMRRSMCAASADRADSRRMLLSSLPKM